MSSGKEHDKATLVYSVPFGVAMGFLLGASNGLIGALAFAIGGLWLSPDLDTKSVCLKRWGYMKWIWWPYRKLITHRSFFSHGPLIGTTLRIFYLLCLIGLIGLLLKTIGVTIPLESGNRLFGLINMHKKRTWTIIIGLEASAWLHLIKDGDPPPSEWRR